MVSSFTHSSGESFSMDVTFEWRLIQEVGAIQQRKEYLRSWELDVQGP